MKKIIVISSVKNECDIIESFCRYNLSFCDAMLIYECHKSSDNTREIISRLIDEGLPIRFEAEEDMFYEAAKKVLAKTAVEKYDADLVVQLDADEFLCHIGGINPRETLEAVPEDVEYQIPWRTYVYEECPHSGFIPAQLVHCRNPVFEEVQGHAGKTLLSRYLLQEKQAEYIEGAHWLVYPGAPPVSGGNKDIKIEESEELFCAHYPIRSKMQAMSKIVPGWINRWTLSEQERMPRAVNPTFQYDILFDIIKENGGLTDEILRHESLTYSLFTLGDRDEINKLIDSLGDELTIEGAIDTAFCKDKLALRYTDAQDAEKAFIRATLSILDNALQHLDEESRRKTQEIRELWLEIYKLREHRDFLEKKIEDIYNSPTWKIGERIARVYRFFARK